MSGDIVYRPDVHRCAPPRGWADRFFHPLMTSEDVGTVWRCECGRLWTPEPFRHRPQENRYWRPMTRWERKRFARRAADHTERNDER